MKSTSILSSLLITLLGTFTPAQAQDDVRIFNTVKTKLEAGEQVVGGTVSTGDPDIYCAMANSGYDFIWIEMQHSHLNYTDAARMIWACKDAPAIPFIRIPDATEGDIQKATDIGALGIIVPMVDTAAKERKQRHREQSLPGLSLFVTSCFRSADYHANAALPVAKSSAF